MKKHLYNACRFLPALLLLLPALLLNLAGSPARGQENEVRQPGMVQTASFEDRIAAVQQKIKTVNDRISVAVGMENQQAADRFKVSIDDLKHRTNVIRECGTVFQRQLEALTKQESLRKELSLLEENARQGSAKTIARQPPYSLNIYDLYLDQHSDAVRQVEVATQAISVGKKSLLEAEERLKASEKKVRALAETGKPNDPSLEWRTMMAEDEKELARALADLQLINADNNALELKLAELKKNINQQNIDWLKRNLTFSQEELATHLAVIDERRRELEQRIDKLLGEQYVAENKWLEAQQQVDSASIPDERQTAISKSYLQARQAWRETYQQVISHNSSMLQLLNREAQLWQRRYAFLKAETPTTELKNWRREAKDEVEELERALALQQAHQNNVQVKIAAIKTQMSKEGINPEVIGHLETSLQALSKLGERNFEYLIVLQGDIELNRRLIASLNDRLQEFNLGDLLTTIGAGIESAWKYELLVVGTYGLTVGKVIIALLILIAGIMLAGLAKRLIHKSLLARLNMSESATAISEKILYYTAVFVVVLIAMRSVHIPMTAFTFLGGAVAIGVGFGAQKLINNFISGFILMAEQPIKVGDLVEMENTLGRIEDIGVRSTRVLNFDNVNLLVPNSYFLENNITNWTHNNNLVRGRVTVGVVYGSSAKLVKTQLLRAAHEHGEVLKSPEPYVFFDDFGDNALVFTLFFWITVRQVIDRKRIESDLRFIIKKFFREANLVIAFPQRDIHFDANRPLRISIAEAETAIGRRAVDAPGRSRSGPEAAERGTSEMNKPRHHD